MTTILMIIFKKKNKRFVNLLPLYLCYFSVKYIFYVLVVHL
jgi:hypothetical protein